MNISGQNAEQAKPLNARDAKDAQGAQPRGFKPGYLLNVNVAQMRGGISRLVNGL
ncbi:MAG TPA: hypothetical protein VGF97_16950 [Rhizomicrobium sp.]|jgi:hypothetical protein